jgi:hypothetical protein
LTGEGRGLVRVQDNRRVEREAHAEGGRAVAEKLVQRGATQANAGESGEARADAGLGICERNAGEGEALGFGEDAEAGESTSCSGQQTFTAGLIDGGVTGVGNEDVGAAEAECYGGGESGRSSSGDEYVTVVVTHMVLHSSLTRMAGEQTSCCRSNLTVAGFGGAGFLLGF